MNMCIHTYVRTYVYCVGVWCVRMYVNVCVLFLRAEYKCVRNLESNTSLTSSIRHPKQLMQTTPHLHLNPEYPCQPIECSNQLPQAFLSFHLALLDQLFKQLIHRHGPEQYGDGCTTRASHTQQCIHTCEATHSAYTHNMYKHTYMHTYVRKYTVQTYSMYILYTYVHIDTDIRTYSLNSVSQMPCTPSKFPSLSLPHKALTSFSLK